jgi:hypothetical protein
LDEAVRAWELQQVSSKSTVLKETLPTTTIDLEEKYNESVLASKKWALGTSDQNDGPSGFENKVSSSTRFTSVGMLPVWTGWLE